MDTLLLERLTGRISGAEFASTMTEPLYSSFQQDYGVFPENCHHSAAVNSLAIEKSDYRYLLSGCGDSSISLWDVKGSEVGDEEDDDGDESGSGSGNEHTGERAHSRGFSNGVAATRLATIPRRTAHQFGVSALSWWPNDTGMFLSASFDHSVNVWDTNSVAVAHTFDMGQRVYAIDVGGGTSAYAGQALVAVASDQPFVRLLDLRAASSAHTLAGHKGKTLAVAWHPQHPHLLATGGHDGEAKVWDIRSADSCLCRLDMTKTNARAPEVDVLNLEALAVKAHLGPVNAVVWDDAGHMLYTGGNDDKVRVWDMASTAAPPVNRLVNFGPLTRNKYLQTLPLLLSPRAETEVQHLLFAADSGDVLVFRALDGKLVSRLQRLGSKHTVRTASMVYAAPYSATYFCGTMDGEIVVWRGSRRAPEMVETYTDSLDTVYRGDEDDAGASRAALYDDPYFRGSGSNN